MKVSLMYFCKEDVLTFVFVVWLVIHEFKISGSTLEPESSMRDKLIQ